MFKKISAAIVIFLFTAIWINAGEQRPDGKGSVRVLRNEIFDRSNTTAGWLENGPAARFIQKNFGDPDNIRIEWVVVPRSEEVAKLNIMMAAGDAPDLCFTYDAVLVGSYAGKGGLTDLTPLLKNATALNQFLGEKVLAWGKWDNKQYAIPGKRQISGISGTWIRKDWLDTLKMPLPKTRDEWLACVRAFRDKDPGNVGTNLVPVFAPSMDVNLVYSFYKPSTERDRAAWIGPSSTRPARDFSIPGAKDALKFMNMLNSEGLLPKDWALIPKNDNVIFNSALTNCYVGTFTSNAAHPWFYNLMEGINKNVPAAIWAPIDPFVNSENKTPKYIYSPYGIFMLVPKFSPNADLVVKYLNWMADNNNLRTIMFGNEGQHYDLNKEGIILPRSLTGDASWEKNLLDRALILNGRPYADLNTAIKALILPFVSDKYPMQMFIDHYKMLEKDGIPPVRIINNPESLDRLGPMLLDKADEFIKTITLAKPDEFEAVYAAKLKEWMDMGAAQVKDDLLKAYDAEHKK